MASSMRAVGALGRALEHEMADFGISVHALAKAVGVRSAVVESWIAGRDAPRGRTWKRVLGVMTRMRKHRHLWRSALEDLGAHNDHENENDNPKEEGTDMSRDHENRPPPESHRASAGQRIAWAREQWERDPSIPINGDEGMISKLKGRFGSAASYDVLAKVRDVAKARYLETKAPTPPTRGLSTPLGTKLRAALDGAVARHTPLPETKLVAPTPSATIPTADAAPPKPEASAAVEEAPPEEKPKRPGPSEEARRKSGHMVRDRPRGWKMTEAIVERREWMRRRFLDAPLTPATHMIRYARERFGVGVDLSEVQAIKAEVQAFLRGESSVAVAPESVSTPTGVVHETRSTPPIAAAPPAPAPTAIAAPIAAAPRPVTDPEETIAAAIEMILESVPNLAALQVSVAPDGTPSASWTLREVKVIEKAGIYAPKPRK